MVFTYRRNDANLTCNVSEIFIIVSTRVDRLEPIQHPVISVRRIISQLSLPYQTFWKYLKQMKAKKEEDAEIIAQIKLLVEELACPKSADEMLTTYKGQEKVLLTNLKKMKDARVEA